MQINSGWSRVLGRMVSVLCTPSLHYILVRPQHPIEEGRNMLRITVTIGSGWWVVVQVHYKGISRITVTIGSGGWVGVQVHDKGISRITVTIGSGYVHNP